MLARSLPVLAVFLVAAGIPAEPVEVGTVAPLTTVRVASGLNRALFATHSPGDFSRLFIVEQRGVIKILNLDTMTVLGTPFLDINSVVGGPSNDFDERGLLGLAFPPDYAASGLFYVYYYTNGASISVARYKRATADQADPSSAFLLLTISEPQTNHNGGWIGFGPNDGYLYIATGDGGAGCDFGSGHTATLGNGQDITSNLLGKMLRIDPTLDDFPGDPDRNYGIPGDNPFVGITGDDEIWAYGLRNPWRDSFDRANGDLYIADVGQDVFEEVNYQPAASTGGENYGWRCFEGNACSNVSACFTSPCSCNAGGLDFPIKVYSHAGPDFGGCSITGGYVYRGCAIPTLDGTYFYADFCSDRIWSFLVSGGSATEQTERTTELAPGGGQSIANIAGFGEDARGEIYIVDRTSASTSEVYKIVPEFPLADFDWNGFVDTVDFFELIGHWGPCAVPLNCPWDLDGNGTVNVIDFFTLIAQWGPTS